MDECPQTGQAGAVAYSCYFGLQDHAWALGVTVQLDQLQCTEVPRAML